MGALLVLIVCVDTCATGWCLARLRQLHELCAELTSSYEQLAGDVAALLRGDEDAR